MRVIVDCDPGLDDAAAIAMLAASKGVDLALLSTTGGNAPVDRVTSNAAAIAAALRLTVPIARGGDGIGRFATDVWGSDGSLPLAPAHIEPETSSLDAILAGAGAPLDVLAIAPLTNIARLVSQQATRARIGALVIMGGAVGRGNVKPHAEFNIWADPGAAAKAFDAGLPLTLVPLDVTRPFVCPSGLAERIGTATPAARLVATLLDHLGKPGHPATLHDAAAAGYLLWPECFTTQRGRIAVETGGDSEGRTTFTDDPGGPHRIVTAIDTGEFWDRFVDLLTR